MKRKILMKALFTIVFLLAGVKVMADPHIICKASSPGMSGSGACVKVHNPSSAKVCTGKADSEICSTSSLEDLCYKIGKATGYGFNRFSSGLGTLPNQEKCLQECEKTYGKFGGKCYGMVPK